MQDTKQRQFLGTVTLQLQRLEFSLAGKLKLLTLLTATGIAGRVALQGIPSVEPLTSMAVLAGLFLGPVYGFLAGATGFFGSNFLVFGGQGPWTLFQSLGAGIAGLVGGLFSWGMRKRWKLVTATALGLVAFETLAILGGCALFLGAIPLTWYALTSLPFALVHIVTSLGFALFIFEFRHSFRKIGGRLIHYETRTYRAVADRTRRLGYRLVPESRTPGNRRRDRDPGDDRYQDTRDA